MEQQLSQINTHNDLVNHLDNLFEKASQRKQGNKNIKFQYLYKKMANPITIKTAIHNMKSNKGSKTKGIDDLDIDFYLQLPEEDLIRMVMKKLENYKPEKVKPQIIPKSNGGQRKLGIPTIIDRIVQETVRLILEPICEGQFYDHSYGFRPLRSTKHALAILESKMYMVKNCSWAVEGDIEKYFDTIDHKIMMKELKRFGIVDKKVLAIIKEMLKAGIMNECEVSDIGTPQGGILSPLLANIYLDKFDQWIAKQWDEKKTKTSYTRKDSRIIALRKTKLKPAYLVRYADDWVLLTNSKENAIWWKNKIDEFLKKELNIQLSREKTLITNYRKKYINFLGYKLKLRPSPKGLQGYVNCSMPNPKRIEEKVKELKKEIQLIGKESKQEYLLRQVEKVNSTIRGIVNYYENATLCNVILNRYEQRLYKTKTRAILPHKGKNCPAKTVSNLIGIHSNYEQSIPAIKVGDIYVGITSLRFAVFKNNMAFPTGMTLYSPSGRYKYAELKKKKPLSIRVDELCTLEYHEKIIRGLTSPMYNFEYFLNRAYAFNRDKGKCKICGERLSKETLETHHNNPKLPINEVNKVPNLSSLCTECHNVVHTEEPNLEKYKKDQRVKIMKLKEKLNS